MPRLPAKPGLSAYNRLADTNSILEQYSKPTLAQVLADPYPERMTFYVVLHHGFWRVIFHKERGAKVFPTQQSAYEHAAVAARDLGSMGFPAQVKVQGADHKWRLEWTYLNDPFPPRG
jgi:hypothetical protein